MAWKFAEDQALIEYGKLQAGQTVRILSCTGLRVAIKAVGTYMSNFHELSRCRLSEEGPWRQPPDRLLEGELERFDSVELIFDTGVETAA
jgi:hypothetical protein